jgi:inner membrane protein
MDSLSQLVLGSTVAALATPSIHRRKAMLVGAVLGTLPDLDSFPLAWIGVDPVGVMTWHRGPSHSLFVLALVGWALWLLLKRAWQPVRAAPRPWFLAIQLALITHPLLDAFTIYGTQLWWPIPTRPIMGGSMFIIDPLYTLPLVVACIVALIRPSGRFAQNALIVGFGLSSAYLAWSLFAQARVDHLAQRDLSAFKLQHAPRFVSPTAFNTLLWRVVVMTPNGYLEGYHSLAADRKPIQFKHFESDTAALALVASYPAVARLTWFNHGFMSAEAREGRLVVSDLRMGAGSDYVFRFVIATSDPSTTWTPIIPQRINWPGENSRFAGVWTRIWREP